MKAQALSRAALLACLAAALLACAGAKEHRYKDGQEVSIWANKGARGRLLPRRVQRRHVPAASHARLLLLGPTVQQHACSNT